MPPRTKNLKSNLEATSKGDEQANTSKRAGKRPITGNEKQRKRAPIRHVEEQTTEEASEVPFTADEEADLQRLNGVFFHPTRYIRVSDLKAMGIYHDVLDIFDKMGLGRFLQHRHQIYPDLTKEFFATVQLIYENARHPDPNEGYLTFKVAKHAYRVSIREICQIYGFIYCEKTKFSTFTNIDEFWELIAAGSPKGSPKMTLIRNPALRIAAKILANTFFARKETGSLKQPELRLLFKGVRKRLTNDSNHLLSDHIESESVNLGCLFAKELANIRTWARTTTDPHCYLGGFLAPLLAHAGVDLTEHYKERMHYYVDRNYLMHCGFLENVSDIFRYIYYDKNRTKYHMLLPCPAKTKVYESDNIRFEYYVAPSETASTNVPQEFPEPNQDEDTWTLPDLNITPKTATERFLLSAFKVQQKINKLAKRKLKWMKTKLRATPGYVSDEEEFMRKEEEAEGQTSRAHNEENDEEVDNLDTDPYRN